MRANSILTCTFLGAGVVINSCPVPPLSSARFMDLRQRSASEAKGENVAGSQAHCSLLQYATMTKKDHSPPSVRLAPPRKTNDVNVRVGIPHSCIAPRVLLWCRCWSARCVAARCDSTRSRHLRDTRMIYGVADRKVIQLSSKRATNFARFHQVTSSVR
jgi:hypothetical protein